MIYSRKDDEISSFHPDDLEQKVLPALSSLIRAMEKKGHQETVWLGGNSDGS